MDLLAVQGTLKSYWTTKKKHRQLTEIRKNNSEQDKMFDKEIEIYIKKNRNTRIKKYNNNNWTEEFNRVSKVDSTIQKKGSAD